jgi:predicted DNA-binding protein
MPAKNPRIHVILENPLYERVRLLAEKDGVSLSTKVRDLIREAIEMQEDIYIARFAEVREASWKAQAVLSHEEV